MKRVLPLLGLLGVALVARPALADTDGRKGSILSVEVKTAGSDDATTIKGKMKVLERRNGPPRVQEYVWGGATCPGRDLTASQVELLVAGMAAGLKIKPRYKPGQAQGSRCLVAFKLKRGGR